MRHPARIRDLSVRWSAPPWPSAGCGGGQMRTAEVDGQGDVQGQAGPTGDGDVHPRGGRPVGHRGDQVRRGVHDDHLLAGDGAILGKHKVVIVAMEDMEERLPEDRTPLPPPIDPRRSTPAPATSPLTTEVKDGDNTPVFDLTDDIVGQGQVVAGHAIRELTVSAGVGRLGDLPWPADPGRSPYNSTSIRAGKACSSSRPWQG